MKKPRFHSTWGMLLAAGMALSFLVPLQAYSATIVIDDMTIGQGSSNTPVINDCSTAGGEETHAITGQPVANIVGGARVLAVTHTVGNGPCTKTYVDASTPKNWVVVNDTDASGWGRIVWSGSNTIGNFGLNLNLSLLQYFNIVRVTADHPTTFTMQVFNSSTQGGQATIVTYGQGGGNSNNVQVLPGSFTAISGLTNVDFNLPVREIRILFDDYLEIDTGLRGVTAVTQEPPAIHCDYKRWNGTSALAVTGTGPYNLTVQFSVSNSGGSPSTIVVEDTMPVGMSYTGPTTCSGGFVLGDPSQAGQVLTWTSTSSLAGGGASVVCSFPAVMAAGSLAVNETKYNVLRARASGGTFGPEECEASITRRDTPTTVPTMNEWGVMVAIAILAAAGFVLARRKREV